MKYITYKYSLIAIHIILLLLIMAEMKSQNPTPAETPAKSMLIANATAHIGNGKVIENSLIGIKNGLIEFVYDATTVKIGDLKFDTIIQAAGKHVYPGLIAMNTTIGLSEIEMVRATNDYSETGDLNSSARSAIAYNTDSKVTPTIRSNGVLLAQVVPEGGMVSGTSSVFKLDGWNWEDALYKADDGLHMYWPRMTLQTGWWAPREDEQRERMRKEMDNVKNLFIDARSYCNAADKPEPNLNLQAMCEVLNGNRKLYIHAQHAKQITAAVNFCKDYQIKMVLVGGDDAWRVAPLLKENNVPVIITRTQQLPSRQDEDIDISYKLPALLKKAGVKFCITDVSFWQQRNLPFEAGNAVAYGISKEEALESITLTPATVLGIDSRTGSLETGKDANLIISVGDVLDMRSSNIENAYIKGAEINLDNIQKQLYRKYCNKYGIKIE